MKRILRTTIAASLLLLAQSSPASMANSVGMVLDLESKITQQVKNQIVAVDPDAIVTTSVTIKSISADLVGTQMQAVGLYSTGDMQKIEDEDIQSVNVTIMSTLQPFPPALAKIVEGTVIGLSKKGKLKIVEMDPAVQQAIAKNKEFQKANQEFQKANAQQLEKLQSLAEIAAREFPGGVLKFLGLLSALLTILVIFGSYVLMLLFRTLGKQISVLKIEGGAAAAAPLPMQIPQTSSRDENAGGNVGSSSILTSQESPFKNMKIESLRALFADAYWCKQDGYASWMWRQIPAESKVPLLEAWPLLRSYLLFLNQVAPQEAEFHLDAYYLKPEPYHQVSNEDLIKHLGDRRYLWHSLSSLRRRSFTINLKERLAYMGAVHAGEPITWPEAPSTPRQLATRIEVSKLSSSDEFTLFANPDLLTREQKKQFPSLIWVALLDLPVRTKILEAIPAQALAEVWKGPPQVLNAIKEGLPEKKRTLLEEYAKRLKPVDESEWLRTISNQALQVLRPEKPIPSERVEGQGDARSDAKAETKAEGGTGSKQEMTPEMIAALMEEMQSDQPAKPQAVDKVEATPAPTPAEVPNVEPVKLEPAKAEPAKAEKKTMTPEEIEALMEQMQNGQDPGASPEPKPETSTDGSGSKPGPKKVA